MMDTLNKIRRMQFKRFTIAMIIALHCAFLSLSSCGFEESAPTEPDFDLSPANPIGGARSGAVAGVINGDTPSPVE